MTPRPPSQLDLAKAVPILDVAGELGLEIVGNSAHCWRKANHAHGDRRPSLGFDVAKNRYKCFVCDQRSGSAVDLAMGVLAISLPDALKWFSRNFDIPKHVQGSRPDFDPRTVTLSTIILSGIWAGLTDSQRTILAVLWYCRDETKGTVTASYSRILRLAGLSNRKTFAATIRFFEESRLIEVQRRNRAASTYRFLEHEDFLRLQRECKNLVTPEDTSLSNKETKLVSPEVTSSVSFDLGTSGKLVTSSPCIKASVSSEVTRFEFSEREQQVLKLAARGFQLFPCRPQSKEPAVGNWRKLATADPRKLARWFTDFPDANWAIATGPVSGIFVVDLDGEQGERSWSELCRQNGGEVNTLTVRTPRGRHLYFTYPDGMVIHNSASKIAPGVDIRGEGGYVLCPPSIHPTGASYGWGGHEDGSVGRLSLNGADEKENLRCHVHGNHAEWWKRSDGDLVCERCHPNPAEVCVQ
jgi:hypothetical protein